MSQSDQVVRIARPTSLRSHYIPHARVQYRNEIINPHTGEITRPPSRTKQEFKDECDINNIIKAYSASGMLSHVSAKAAQGAYLELPDSVDFQQSLHTVKAAETAFMTLPSKLRDRFQNDPAQFLAFCGDPGNLAEMRELGIALPPPPAPAVPLPGASPAAGNSPPQTPTPTEQKTT